MAGIGTGYDVSAMTYSPEGKVFQIEYAHKAVDNSGTAIGLRCKDGIVLAVEKIVPSKMLESTSNKRIGTIDEHVGCAIAGLLADGRQLMGRARQEAESYHHNFNSVIPLRVLNDRIAGYVQMFTLYASVRPFGCSLIFGGKDVHGPQLFMVEPSGISYGYYGCAIGKAKASAKTEIEKLKLSEMTCREAIKHAARIIYSVHDELKDRDWELELSWVSDESKNKHVRVPQDLKDEAETLAKQALEDAMDR
jgi:20S proteasome subunit alpha 7